MVERHLKDLERRRAELRRWLAEHAPDVEREQRHLHEGSAERAYWHYGYYVALNDVWAMMAGSGDARR